VSPVTLRGGSPDAAGIGYSERFHGNEKSDHKWSLTSECYHNRE